jgi:hydrogenase maturation protein HypF
MSIVSRIITISGIVQGVGFRPFVARIAQSLGVTGTVANTSNGVKINIQGPEEVIREFITIIRNNPPSLARIDMIDIIAAENVVSYDTFDIIESGPGLKPTVEIAPDTAVCEKCLQEMRSADDRRRGHPFINCTECGPRYSIIYRIPYDRHNTAMNQFPMCPECADEYNDQVSRRYHAQPVCCPDCGPRLRLLDNKGEEIRCGSIIETVRKLLLSEKIIAIKGIGGFHLSCLASSQSAVVRLRNSKSRKVKPFACMVKDLEAASRYAVVSPSDSKLLSNCRAPIVLLEKTPSCDTLLPQVAPGLSNIGLMLPYTPLHHLLFQDTPFDCLVMTSANEQGEPMYVNDYEITSRKDIAFDAVLTHDRPIAVRLDDSVVRPTGEGCIILRRGRGYVPSSIKAPFDVEGIVGLGAQMKNSITIGSGRNCFISEYMGTTDSVLVVNECVKTLGRLSQMFQVVPQLYVNDLHPSGIESRLIDKDIPSVRVQHHHAHVAACMGEHSLMGNVIGVCYDGTGAGDDGTLWGSEIFVADYTSYTRMAHLSSIPLVGNDAAIENPARLALAICADSGYNNEHIVPWMDPQERDVVLTLLKKQAFSTQSTGMGRLFDACAAITDICRKRTYEGQPAIELEGCADRFCKEHYPIDIFQTDNNFIMDGRSVLFSVIEDRNAGVTPSVIAARFHNTIVEMTLKCVKIVAEVMGIKQVVLSGGCFGNRILLERTVKRLRDERFNVYCHKQLPPGDENISLGQVLIAAAMKENGLTGL